MILTGDDAARAGAFLPSKIEEVVGVHYKANATEWKLLWRASRDGFGASTFHNKCDNQGSTITVVKSASGFVFGAATGVEWGSNSGYVGTTEAFLFGIRTYGSPDAAVAFTLTDAYRATFAMFDKSGFGPQFGVVDLVIGPNGGGIDSGYSNIGWAYTGNGIALHDETLNASKQYFAGSQDPGPLPSNRFNFKVAEIEVFKLV